LTVTEESDIPEKKSSVLVKGSFWIWSRTWYFGRTYANFTSSKVLQLLYFRNRIHCGLEKAYWILFEAVQTICNFDHAKWICMDNANPSNEAYNGRSPWL